MKVNKGESRYTEVDTPQKKKKQQYKNEFKSISFLKR